MIEIEFIPVGEETNTGDALLCHFTQPGTTVERVVVIDGGFVTTSDAIVTHIQQYYGTSRVDLVVCTHPDADHINGLTGVIETLDVTTLVIHRPSEHGYTSDDVAATAVNDLIKVAENNGTQVITDAYAGSTFFDAITILGPTKEFYLEQLEAQVKKTGVRAAAGRVLGGLLEAMSKALRSRTTDPGEGDFTDNGGTTPRNNSSIVLDVQVEGYRAILTGDAGVPALTAADDTASSLGVNGSYPDFFDVPHHGSRHNLDTDTANQLLGPIGGPQTGTAFVSVGKKAEDFPRSEVANALKRRGYSVSPTRGQTIRWSRNAPARLGWVTLTPLGWLEVD
jgi:beta-lactamase superfamily II metal-dependent hydrolase